MEYGVRHRDPLIIEFPNFLNPKDCDKFIDLTKGNLEKARVVDIDLKEKFSLGRTNETSVFTLDHSSFIKQFASSFTKCFSLQTKNLTSFQVLKYSKSQHYSQHFDAYSEKTLSNRGKSQRLFTFIIYLNDDFLGGHTAFPLLDISIEPKKGSLLAFQNCFEGTEYAHPKSLHTSIPVQEGIKWALLFWSKETLVLDEIAS